MTRLLASASLIVLAATFATGAAAQEGTLAKAVGGYTFEEAAKEAARAQAAQALAGRRLRQVEQLRRTADVAGAVDGVEQPQQVEVQVPDMHFANTA